MVPQRKGTPADRRARRKVPAVAVSSRRRANVSRLAAAGWGTAPFTAAIVGSGTLRLRVADVFLAGALVGSALTAPRRRGLARIPRRPFRLLVGIALMGAGVVAGTTATGALGDVPQLAGFAVAAALPALFLVWSRPDRRETRQLALAFLAGTCVSVLAALVLGQRTPAGAAIGYAAHRNQLGMTIAMSLPLVGLWPVRWQRCAVYALLLVGANETGSRSAFLGIAVSGGLLLLAWVRRRPSRMFPVTITATAAVIVGILTVGGGVRGESSVARLLGAESAERSNEEREGLLAMALDGLTVKTALIGFGYDDDQAPHNAFVETWLAGGAVAAVGVALVMRWALRPLRSLTRRAWPPPDAYRYAAAVAAWAAIVSLNNLLWAPFVWAMIAMAVYAQAAGWRRAAS
jgi:hypothetical protein